MKTSIILKNNLTIQTSTDIAAYLWKQLGLDGFPGLFAGTTPPDSETLSLRIPRGFMKRLTEALLALGVEYSLTDITTTCDSLPLRFEGLYKERQAEAERSILPHRFCIMECGKGLIERIAIAMRVISARKQPSLILADIHDLYEWNDCASEFMSSPNGEPSIAMVLDARQFTGNLPDILIAWPGAIKRRVHWLDKYYGQLVVDQPETMSLEDLLTVVSGFSTRYILGLADNLHSADVPLLECFLGDKIGLPPTSLHRVSMSGKNASHNAIGGRGF